MSRSFIVQFKRFVRHIVLLIDIVLLCASFLGSYFLRFNFQVPEPYLLQAIQFLPFVILIKVPIFITCGLYREMWRKVSLISVKKMLIANVISSALIALVAFVIVYLQVVPRAVLINDFLLSLLLISGSRMAYRIYVETQGDGDTEREATKRVVIIGAGFLGESIVREMMVDRHAGMVPVVFLDDDMTKVNKSLLGIAIEGPIDTLVSWVEKKRADLVIIAISELVGKRLKEIIARCDEAKKRFGCEYKIVPGNRAIIEGRVNISQIRNINAEDLLRRAPVTIDTAAIEKHLFEKTILVTGAAGSIGSELVRQIHGYLPARLLLIDKGESPLFFLQQELNARKTNTKIEYIIGDVCNYEKMEAIFERFKPEVIFHAAAYKHVPLMEHNPEEAIRNNVVSTQNLVNLANHYEVKNFVMISTDKSVRPTNIMGASKKIAEYVVQSHAKRSKTVYTTVRFGNVIGSDGSLVPVLLRQIRNGGPVTVTHKDITRYFMTIPEAVRLVTQAMSMGKGGEVFILDMGQPIVIRELAEDLIRLSGYIPHEQIEIVYTGLRPGEKMYEELWNEDEEVVTTGHPGIRMAVKKGEINGKYDQKIHDLLKSAKVYNRQEIVERITAIIPDALLEKI